MVSRVTHAVRNPHTANLQLPFTDFHSCVTDLNRTEARTGGHPDRRTDELQRTMRPPVWKAAE